MNNFDKANLAVIRSELNALLAEFGKKHGIEMGVGRIKFSDFDFEAQVTAKIEGQQTFKEIQSDKNLEFVMRMHKLKADGVGNRTLISYKAANHKYPFIYEHEGWRFKCSIEQAKMYFSDKEQA